MRWRSRRRQPDPRDEANAAGGAEPDRDPTPAGHDERDGDLPPPAAPLPRPPVRVVSGDEPEAPRPAPRDASVVSAQDGPEAPLFTPPEATDGPTEAAEGPTGATDDPVGATDEPLEATDGPLEATDEPPEATDEPIGDVRGLGPGRQGAPAPLPGDAHLPVEPLAAAARAVVRVALDEDLDVVGDVTAEATLPPDATGRARLVARADGVVAGLGLVADVYDHLDPRVEVRTVAADGDRVRRGDVVAEVAGPLRSVLCGERTALNLVTHLSGVATLTARYVAAVAGTGCAIRDTRKTTPGLRLLEKAAVVAGGGVNHRIGLSDALLVKDNHVAAAGGVAAATRAAIAGARGRHVQIEVDSLEELEEAVGAGARDVLLDNLGPDETARAVARVRGLEATHGRILLESSGGLDLDTVRAHAEAGVDRLAIGALTHSAPHLDLALDLDAPHTEAADPPVTAVGTGAPPPDGAGA